MKYEKKFDIKKFLIINFGTIIIALGLYYFLIPANLVVGGVTGFSMVLNYVFPIVPIGIFMLIFNILLFILAFVVIGKEFGGYTIYTSLVLSGIISVLETITPMSAPLVEDMMLNLIFGILIHGVGMAMIFNQNTSTGGTDIIAKIISQFTHLEIGKSLFLADFLIVLSGALVFGLELGLYALLGIIINTVVIDKVIAGFGTRIKVAIISEREKEICKFITEEIYRGVTLFHGVGGFSQSDKKVINTIVSRKEYIRIKNKVKEIDPRAFVWMSFVNEVLGEGFTE